METDLVGKTFYEKSYKDAVVSKWVAHKKLYAIIAHEEDHRAIIHVYNGLHVVCRIVDEVITGYARETSVEFVETDNCLDAFIIRVISNDCLVPRLTSLCFYWISQGEMWNKTNSDYQLPR